MGRTIQVTETKNFDIVDSTYNSSEVSSVSGLSNGYNPFSHGSNYASIYLKTGASAETKFNFDFAVSLPTGATINSVFCYARASISQTTGVNARRIQLCSGSTAKGSAVTLGTSVSTITSTDLADNTSWTASELESATLNLYASRNSSGSNLSSSRYLKFYGATISINCTYNQSQYEVTAVNHYTAVNITFSDTQAFVNYGTDFVLTIYGDLTGCVVLDNGNDVSSQLVLSNTNEYQYTIVGDGKDHDIEIVKGVPQKPHFYIKTKNEWFECSDVYIKKNGSWKHVDNVYKKTSQGYVQQAGIWSLFDNDALYIAVPPI